LHNWTESFMNVQPASLAPSLDQPLPIVGVSQLHPAGGAAGQFLVRRLGKWEGGGGGVAFRCRPCSRGRSQYRAGLLEIDCPIKECSAAPGPDLLSVSKMSGIMGLVSCDNTRPLPSRGSCCNFPSRPLPHSVYPLPLPRRHYYRNYIPSLPTALLPTNNAAFQLLLLYFQHRT
jgi:hypothetical protein